MTDDHAALLDHLKIKQADVLGWSDGGIEALLLALRHPAKVKKIAVMGAALNPTEEAVYPEVIGLVKSTIAAMPDSVRVTPQGQREVKVTQMLLDEPHIPMNALERIAAPTLVMAGRVALRAPSRHQFLIPSRPETRRIPSGFRDPPARAATFNQTLFTTTRSDSLGEKEVEDLAHHGLSLLFVAAEI